MLECFPLPEARREQIGCLKRIHQALIVEDRRVFVLDAPTGVGKSAIGVAAATYCGSAFITSPQNALVKQYENDYRRLSTVIGKANYECRNFNFHGRPVFMDERDCQTAEDWNEDLHKKVCRDYIPARNEFWRGPLSATNVDFLFWAHCPENLADNSADNSAEDLGRPRRRLLVVDECHGLEKKLIDLGTIKITPAHCARVGYDMLRFPRLPNQQSKAEAALREYQAQIAHTQFDTPKQARTYKMESDQIDVALESGDWYYWTLDVNGFAVCPMNASVAAAKLFARADKLLFMSATTGRADAFLSGLGIPETEAVCLSVESPFPVKNRILSYRPAAYMTKKNYTQSLPQMQHACREIIRHYPNDKGLVLCQSYPMQLDLARGFKEFGARILTHTKDDREELIAQHCESAEPTVLLGVAMFEGIDLKDARARFLIFPKMPYPNLGDPYVAERKRRDEQWYAQQVALAIVQGAGRVVRSDTDYADIYMLDSCFLRFINTNESLFPPWFLDAIEICDERRPHSVSRGLTVKMIRRRSSRARGKWVLWTDPRDGRERLSPEDVPRRRGVHLDP